MFLPACVSLCVFVRARVCVCVWVSERAYVYAFMCLFLDQNTGKRNRGENVKMQTQSLRENGGNREKDIGRGREEVIG